MSIKTTDEAKTKSNILYLSLGKNHSFHNKREKIDVASVTGQLTAVRVRVSEYEGKPNPKIQMWFEDKSDEKWPLLSVEFGQHSWFAYRVFLRLLNTDLTKPFELGIFTGEAKNGGNAPDYPWIKQDGQVVEPSDDGTVPQPEKVKVGKNEVLNWEPFEEYVDKVIQSLRGVLEQQNFALDGEAAVAPAQPVEEKSEEEISF